MEVVKASTSDYGQTLDHLERIERDELIHRELSVNREPDTKNLETMSIFDLRKRHPGFTLPPVELPPVRSGESLPLYRCPYCGVSLRDLGDLLTCRNCSGRSWKK